MLPYRRVSACAVALSLLATAIPAVTAQAQITRTRAGIAYQLKLPKGQTAIVFSNGIAQVYSKDHKQVQTRLVSLPQRQDGLSATVALPDKGHLIAMLGKAPQRAYEEGRIVVVYRTGVSAASDSMAVPSSTLVGMRRSVARRQPLAQVPQYTNDAATNRALASLGADRSDRLFKQFNRSTLSAMHSGASSIGAASLDFSNAYRIHLTGSSVFHAVQTLSKLPAVAYVSPDWTVETMQSPAIALPSQGRRSTMSAPMATSAASTLPSNYAATSSLQSMLNAPSDDVMAAYDEIDRHFHQLPGQGEIVTNVSIGDLDDASAAANSSDPCNFWASVFGPTTEIVGGQRYLNLPSMPLIPTYTADSSGNLSGTGEVCGLDPYIGEIGLDFSMMSPLPHELQRPGEQGSGVTDLVGIAPGAQYRLIVPASFNPTYTDIDAALLGAALQSPRTNVITASLGYGYDTYGFSGRYLEDDPLTEAIVAAIVQSYHIVVSISAGDGTRTYTTVAIGPSGGSVPTEKIAPGDTPTSLDDVGFSTVPSRDFDSGSIDAGGTTLDDIFAAPPQFSGPALQSQHAFPETRWTGFTNFSSGFGSRVNVSAPSDNVISFEHPFGGADDSVSVVVEGGTSASSPEIAASAAVLLQVARLTGHPFSDPKQLRAFLESTGSPVPNVPQADTNVHVGPQIDVRRAVEALLARAGTIDAPSVPRVAVEQRRNIGNLDGAFESDTDPSNIDLQNGILSGAGTDRDEYAWITIAPDWEFVSPSASYTLKVTGTNKVLATTPWARLLPQTILNAAGYPLVSSSTRTVNLTYTAKNGMKPVSTTFSLTFGPSDPTSLAVLAPHVPAVITGSTIPVSYDFSYARNPSNPELLVSQPGRLDSATGQQFHPILAIPLSATKGTVQVPVSSLHGGGIYGIGLFVNTTGPITYHSDFAFTRIVPQESSSARPQAPLLSSNGSTPGHYLEIPYGGSFQVTYNVSDVPGATGAMVEVSAAGPTAWGIYNPFNNPNGTVRDANGIDSGSVYFAPVSGTSGTITLNANAAGLYPSLNQVVRVIPMKFGVAAGEGSDVSSITEDGVLASDGGYVNNGWGVNGSGLDGFITSGQQTSSGQVLTSLETFDQTNNAIMQNVSSGSGSLFFTNGWGIYANDIGLYGLFNIAAGTSNYNLLNTVAGGTIGNAWTPPTTLFIDEGAANQANDVAAFYGYNPSNSSFQAFTSRIDQNTFSSIYTLNPAMTSLTTPDVFAFGEDTTANTGLAVTTDLSSGCGTPLMVTVDLSNGTLRSYSGIGAGFPYGIGVDSKAEKAAVPTLCDGGLGIYNLATKTTSEIALPGNEFGFYTAADSANTLFLTAQTVNPDFAQNNNSLSQVLVYDENGNLLKEIPRFNLFNSFFTIQANNLQVNGTKRYGYLIGPGQQQLAPFSY